MAQINALRLRELRTRRGQNKLQLGLEQSIVKYPVQLLRDLLHGTKLIS